MHELRLLFTPTDSDTFRAHLTDSAGADVGNAVEITPMLSEADYDELRWYLEEYMDLPDGGAVVRAGRLEAKLPQWGRALYSAIFADKQNRELLETLLAGPEPRGLTIATDRAELLRLPWELLEDDAGSLALRLSVRRQLPESKPVMPRPAKLPLRILYIVSRPGDTGFIDPRMTARSVLAALAPLGAAVQVDFCRPPTVSRMEEMLRAAQQPGSAGPYDVVHFDGHGTYMPQAAIGALCFEQAGDGAGSTETDLVTADVLGNTLANYNVPLVVLEACRSGTMKTLTFRSVAPRLIRAGVGSVVSMGHSVHVEAARLLLDRFYRELVLGVAVGRAVAEARRALHAKAARWIETGPQGRTIRLSDWFLPHLYQRGPDEALLPANAAAETKPRQYDIFLSHNHGDSTRVESLARLLTESHSLNVWLDKWECIPGKLEPQCERGIRDSRFTVVVGSQKALNSKWVAWEIAKHVELNPSEDRLIPLLFQPLTLPDNLNGLLWVDFTDPAKDAGGAAVLVGMIRSADATDARRRSGFRPPPPRGHPGAFPEPPQFGFQGRARELYELERMLRRRRGVVLHAMGGMGKTTLATEAAAWWTRSGLFRDGACFVSFERALTAERIVQVLGGYLRGPMFDQLPAVAQRRKAVELFREHAVLMVWDNYESVLPQFQAGDAAAEQASPYNDEERRRLAELFADLTSGEGKGCILVTCRPGDTHLPGAQRLELGGLARPDSLWLLHRILERDNLSLGDPRFARTELDTLLADLADHPLSLELVGPHLKTLAPRAIREDFANLLAKFHQPHAEGRNTSLLASLEFSRRHLSPAARDALPWLGLFSGGVFEDILLDLSQIAPAAWEPIRAELQGIALLRPEADIQIAGRPFLRFHPTLAIASADAALAGKPEVRQRFVDVYLALRQALDKALTGSQSRAALAILDREEPNYRTAVRWAVADQQYQAAAALGDTFAVYLQMSGRLRERDAWVQWMRESVSQQGFTEEAAQYERQHAWTLFTNGDPKAAVEKLEALVERLRQTTEFDPAFHLATTLVVLGRVLDEAGASTRAVPVLRESVTHWEALVEKAGGKPWHVLLDAQEHEKARTQLGNLSAAMGDLANALTSTAAFDEALAAAEAGVRVNERLGNDRNAAAAHGLCANIVMASGRPDEADARYDLALAAARRAGDKELEGAFLQHQGGLANGHNQPDRAARLYQQALRLFQEAGDNQGTMQTYNSLGVVERKAGRLPEARAWYGKSRELAEQLKDQVGLGQAAQNLGIVCQLEGEAARASGDEAAARRHFEEARRNVEESLRAWQSLRNQPNEAASLSQLSQIHLLLGDLAAAERHAHEARKIRESLGVLDVWGDYDTLSEIAQARGDAAAAAEWAKKRDDLLAEKKRRAGGAGVPGGMLKALQALGIACAQAGLAGEPAGPAEQEALATLETHPAPYPAFAAFLRQLAAGQLPSPPAGMPKELAELAEGLTQAVRRAKGG